MGAKPSSEPVLTSYHWLDQFSVKLESKYISFHTRKWIDIMKAKRQLEGWVGRWTSLIQREGNMNSRADSKFAPSQWEMTLFCNNISHWLGASLESVLNSEVENFGCMEGNKNSVVKLPVGRHFSKSSLFQISMQCATCISSHLENLSCNNHDMMDCIQKYGNLQVAKWKGKYWCYKYTHTFVFLQQ